MFRILKNTFLSSCAKLEKRVTVAIDAMPDAQDLAVEHETPHTILVKRCDSQIVMRTINDLPVHFRQVLFLCEVEDMSYQEIADVLSIPIGTVMSRLARARQVLRKSVGITRSVLLPVNNHSTRFSTASSRNGR